MIALSSIASRPMGYHILPALFSLIYMGCAALALNDYIVFQYLNIIIGIIGIANASAISTTETKSSRYGYFAMALSVLYLFVQVKTLLYLCIVFALFSVIESYYGRLNYLPLIIVLLVSPVTQHFVNVFSFPLRLQLTSYAGGLLSLFAKQASTVQGNIITHNGNDFSVDPACMGLSMLTTSLVCAIAVVAVYERKFNRKCTGLLIAISLCLVTMLNIVSNVIRIVCLVNFSMMPATAMHEITGILCFVVYVILPTVYVIKMLVHKWGSLKMDIVANTQKPIANRWLIITQIMLACLCGYVTKVQLKNNQHSTLSSLVFTKVKDYTCKEVEKDILKLDNSNSLVYIKRIAAFYRSDHQPMICWRGSGFTFKNIQEDSVENHKIYTGTLQKGKEILYTAWWYDNGIETTTSQLFWRWQMLQGKPAFAIINISAASKAGLSNEVKNVLLNNTFCRLVN